MASNPESAGPMHSGREIPGMPTDPINNVHNQVMVPDPARAKIIRVMAMTTKVTATGTSNGIKSRPEKRERAGFQTVSDAIMSVMMKHAGEQEQFGMSR